MTAYLFGVNVRVLGEATKSKDSNSHCGGFYEFYMRLSDHLHRERRSFDGSAGQQHDLIVYPFLFFLSRSIVIFCFRRGCPWVEDACFLCYP